MSTVRPAASCMRPPARLLPQPLPQRGEPPGCQVRAERREFPLGSREELRGVGGAEGVGREVACGGTKAGVGWWAGGWVGSDTFM